MKTNTWLHMKWYDSQLRWNPDRYGSIFYFFLFNSKMNLRNLGGVDQINVPFSNVWTPVDSNPSNLSFVLLTLFIFF